MTTCPNCGHQITDKDETCENCGFNLKKYREDFFTDQHHEEKYEEPDEAGKIASRAAYRREFYPEKQNNTIKKMIAWVRANATIVFLLGVLLLIIMSFSRPLGWICFLGLMVWLIIVCDRTEKINQYTSDRRLTEKINQIGSNIFNSVEDRSEKLRTRSQKFESSHPNVENHVEEVKKSRQHRFSYVQLSVVLTAFISLIVLFSGSGASVVDAAYAEKMSISKVLLSLGGRLLSSGQTFGYAIVFYLVWLLLILFPIFIIYNIFKNTKRSQWLSFILSVIETVFLIYIIFRMSNTTRASTGILSRLTSQLLTYAVSVGASTYFLILASVMTTGLSGFNLFSKKHQEQTEE